MPVSRTATVPAVALIALAFASSCGNGSSAPPAARPSAPGTSASASPSASPTPDGVPFTSDQWHFSMTFPDDPAQRPLDQKVDGKTIPGRLFLTQDVGVTVILFPPDAVIDTDAALQGEITGGASSTGGTIVEQHAETFQGHKARQGTIRAQGTTVFIEAIADGHRLYAITATPRGRFDAALASFRTR